MVTPKIAAFATFNESLIPSDLSFAGAFISLKPLVTFVIAVVIYSVFIFKFYRFLARRDIIKLNLKQYATSGYGAFQSFFATFFYIIEYLLLFPLLILFWCFFLIVLLAFLSKNPDPQNILLAAMALVTAVRITAYYNEELSKDLAKMLPFALLGVYLIDASYFSFTDSIILLKQLQPNIDTFVYFLIFIVALEFVLRIARLIINPIEDKEDYRTE